MPDSLGRFMKGEHWRPRKPHWDKEWLVRHYVEMGRSACEMAEICGCTEHNIFYWLKRYGISRRSIVEARELKYWGLSGHANPMYGKFGQASPSYIHGNTPERQRQYSRTIGKQFLHDVLTRDGYRCQRCRSGKTTPKSLHVHHIKDWETNPEIRFDLLNAVTLCCRCHGWVHSKKNTAREFLA